MGGEGESDTHRKWKSFAVSRLKELYTESEREYCGPEIVLDVDGIETDADYRQADALVRFEEPHDRLGNGLIVEVQYKNKEKDIEATTNDYLQLGYSVVWAEEDDFSSDRCLLDRNQLERRAVSVFPNAVPKPGEWEPVECDLRGLNQRRSKPLPDQFSNLDTYAEKREYRNRRWTENAYGAEFSPVPKVVVKLPTEWYKERARQYYREIEWDDLFEDYVWDTRKVGTEWGDLAKMDEFEVNIPLSKWLADDGKALIVGECNLGPRYRYRDDIERTRLKNGKISNPTAIEGEQATISAPVSKLVDYSPNETIELYNCYLIDVEVYIPNLLLWEFAPWEDLFSGTLELPIKADTRDKPTTPKGEIPIGEWIATEPTPQIRKVLRKAFDRGHQNIPKSGQEKIEAKLRVFRIVNHNTGDPQPEYIRERTILTIASHANISPDAVRWAIQRLVSNGDLEVGKGSEYKLPDAKTSEKIANRTKPPARS